MARTLIGSQEWRHGGTSMVSVDGTGIVINNLDPIEPGEEVTDRPLTAEEALDLATRHRTFAVLLQRAVNEVG
jgi:hypothetical protein